jgi:hypothetical protein
VDVASGLNIAAFNIGIALGSIIGGQTVEHLVNPDPVDWRGDCPGRLPADWLSGRLDKPARVALG